MTQIWQEDRPDLWEGDYVKVVDGVQVAYEDFANGDEADVWCELLHREDGLWEVVVAQQYEDPWVDELYEDEAEARRAYAGRIKETRKNTPFYVCNVWCGCDEAGHCPRRLASEGQQ